MKRAFLLLLFLACTLGASGLPTAEAPAVDASRGVLDLAELGLTPQPVNQSCSALGVCCNLYGCWFLDTGPFGGGEECTIHNVICGAKTYGECTFIKQKDNGKCVYECPYTRTCTEITCEGSSQFTDYGTDRIRVGPYPPGACPGSIEPTSGEIEE